jgi:hypothetical protein
MKPDGTDKMTEMDASKLYTFGTRKHFAIPNL